MILIVRPKDHEVKRKINPVGGKKSLIRSKSKQNITRMSILYRTRIKVRRDHSMFPSAPGYINRYCSLRRRKSS